MLELTAREKGANVRQTKDEIQNYQPVHRI